MKKSSTIIVVGSINMDLVTKIEHFPKDGETVTGLDSFTVEGGKGANQAVAAARLGADVSFVGAVGDNDFGKRLLSSLKKEKVDINNVEIIKNTPTGTAIITIDATGQNQIIVVPGTNHKLTIKQIDNAFKKIKSHNTALLLQLEIPMDKVLYAAELAKEKGTLVVLNPGPARPLPEKLLKLVDYIIPNEQEILTITGKNTIDEAVSHLHALGIDNVIITMGERGVLYYNKSPMHKKAYKVRAVDATAAGDTFVAAFTVATLEGKSKEEAINFAQAAGALAATKMGAQPSLPTRKEIDNFLKFYKDK